MIKTLSVTAATLFVALSVAAIPSSHACDEDCVYEAQEAAYERAYEREAAREEAEEEGYYSGSRRSSSRSARRREQATDARAPQAAKRRTAEPKPDPTPRTQTPPPRIKVANENSSISTAFESGGRDVAEDESYAQSAKGIGCKSYLPAVGMTLSVPCD